MTHKYSPNSVLQLMGKEDKTLNYYDERLTTPNLKDDRKAWYLAHRGEANLQMGKRAEAKVDLQEATRLNPEYAWAHAKLGEVYRMDGNTAKASIDRWRDYNLAIESFTKALEHDPDNAWVCAHRGAAYANMRLKRYLGSVGYAELGGSLSSEVDMKPENWESVKQIIGQKFPSTYPKEPLTDVVPKAAELNYSRSLAIEQADAQPRKKIILTQSLVRNTIDVFEYMYEDAKRDLERAIDLLSGEYAWAIGYLGTIEFIKAADDFKDNEDENDPDAAIMLFKAHHHLMNAILKDNTLLNQAIEPGRRHQSIFLEFAKLLFDLNRFQEALEYSIKALLEVSEELDTARVYYLRSRIFSELGRGSEMQDDARKVKSFLADKIPSRASTPKQGGGQANNSAPTEEETKEIEKMNEYADAVLGVSVSDARELAAAPTVVSEAPLLYMKRVSEREKNPNSAAAFRIAIQVDRIAWE